MSDQNDKIDKLLTIVAKTILGAGVEQEALWPLYTPRGLLYWREAWASKLFKLLKELDKKGFSSEEIAKLFLASSRLAQTLWRIDAIKRSHLSKEEKLYTVQKLLNCLETYRKKDVFCRDGRNIVWGSDEIKKATKHLHFFDVTKNKDTKRLICALESSLWLYTELIYWTNHPFGHSFHGSYKIKGGDLVVRNYLQLRPEIWPFTKKLKLNQIVVFEIYKGVKIKFDFFERGIRTTRSFRDKLQKFAVMIDGKPAKNKNVLKSTLKNLSLVAEEGARYMQTLDIKGLIFKHAEMWFYVLKPLCEAVDEDWCPPQQVHDDVFKRFDEIEKTWKKIQMESKVRFKLSRRVMTEKIRKDFDPRL